MVNYKKFKPQLRVEFDYQCPYCHTREPEIGGSKVFHIDHYKPQKEFPELISEYSNLIYSCPDCNRYKGGFWPKYKDLLMRRVIIYLRPPKQIHKHLDVTEHRWKAKTKKGSWNIEKLQLNSEINIKRRQRRTSFQKTILHLQKLQDELRYHPNYDKQRVEFDAQIADLEQQINFLISSISGPLD